MKMKKVEYKCNMCWEVVDQKDIFCYYFKCDKMPQGYELSNKLDLSDKHICKSCLETLRNQK